MCTLETVVKENNLTKPIAGKMCTFVLKTIAKEKTGRPYNQKERSLCLKLVNNIHFMVH